MAAISTAILLLMALGLYFGLSRQDRGPIEAVRATDVAGVTAVA